MTPEGGRLLTMLDRAAIAAFVRFISEYAKVES